MRYHLSPAVVLKVADGEIRIIGEQDILRLRSGEARIAEALLMLRSGSTIDELSTVLPDHQCRKLIALLNDIKAIVHCSDEESAGTHYERQFGYLAQLSPDPGAAQRALRRSRVAIVGLGGVGGCVLQHLAGAGIRRFQLIDHDTVALDNLNRQFLYDLRSIATPKTTAAIAYLRRMIPDSDVACWNIRVESPGDLMVLDGDPPDLLIAAADQPVGEIQKIINDYCWRRNIPFIMGGVGLAAGHWGPLVVPGKTGCFRCFDDELASTLSDMERWARYEIRETGKYSFGPTNAMISAMIAADSVAYLAGAENIPSLGTRLVMNFSGPGIARFAGSSTSCTHRPDERHPAPANGHHAPPVRP